MWNKYELKWPRWGGGRPTGGSIHGVLRFHARLLNFCAAFSNLAITPSSEVEKMRRLLGWNLDFKMLLVVYHLTLVSSRVGTDLDVKLMLLLRNLESCVCNLSQLA